MSQQVTRRGFLAAAVGAFIAQYLPKPKLLMPRVHYKSLGYSITREMIEDDIYKEYRPWFVDKDMVSNSRLTQFHNVRMDGAMVANKRLLGL